MTTASQTRPQPHQQEGGARAARVTGPYLGYVGYFVGAGLISGGIVHQPLDPARYTTIALAGVVVFLGATVLNEFFLAPVRPTGSRAVRLIVASLALSVGIGMLSGGIQHFLDFPQRAAVLIPVGVVLSFLAYVARNGHTPVRTVAGWRGAGVVVLALGTFLVLQPVAAGLAADGNEHHGAAESGTSADTHGSGPAKADDHGDGDAH